MTIPLGITMLFLMAVAPVLPWRKASTELLRDRLFWPAVVGVGTLVVCVAFGADGLSPLLAFGLAGFAAGAAGRQLVLATRRHGWRGFVGRANGGMVVHLGVIVISAALAAGGAYTHRQELQLMPGQTASFGGHTFTYQGWEEEESAQRITIKALVSIDGGQAYAPALQRYTAQGMTIGTPSVKTGLLKDLYLVLEERPSDERGARLSVFIKPLTIWLWIGGALMAVGTVLAAFPGSRRRPIDPVSAPAGVPGDDRDREAVTTRA
jgi:cytochrome c-type biogenesis protein CcmF